VRGSLAWLVRRTYYLMQMPGWGRRLRIMIDWFFALLFPPTRQGQPGQRGGRTPGGGTETLEQRAARNVRAVGGRPLRRRKVERRGRRGYE